MSKIEEMATEYKKMHPSATTFGNKEVNREVEYAYIDGANAVLREIEKAFDISKPYLGNPFATLEERAKGVYDLVKELKGE